MSDPTVFDNLKVVLEGALYDLDAESGCEISDRSDIVDLAKMTRTCCLSISYGEIEAVIELSTDAVNWSGEVLDPQGGQYMCTLYI